MHFIKNFRTVLYSSVLFFSLLTGTACKKEAEANPPAVEAAQSEKSNLVSFKFVGIIPVETIRDIASKNGYPQFNNEFKYDITVFSVVYNTTYQGRETQASGLLVFPRNKETPPAILSAQHGTLFAHKDAPSNFPISFNGPELFASAGYATFIPDYLGYGASKQILHPYYNETYSATAVRDIIRAGRFFCKDQNIPLGNKLFLAGYSEGGYVTLAAQKNLEANPLPGLTLAGVAAGAGGYDLTAMIGNIASGETYNHPSYLAFLTQAYNTANNWNRPLNQLFKEPYASKIPGLLDGSKTGGQVNSELPKLPSQLFTEAFYNGLKTGTETQFINALAENSLTDWAPQAPTRLYHGTADDVVPFQNSQITYSKLKKNGAKQLDLYPIPGGTHGTTFQPMIMELIPWFASLQ
ncbi:alpha/beta fold hydrolase [Adhaeribacter sp. BT258]|uniref:Alpha/beta fold hydrolase n=1 Tax=Adhaeribacter terrigena TaxID=2793070 RepID=A0ABS1C3I2_9BACT|nr:alpha/beta fold hydrolase [Adhaeribacter terrigena]MBK0403962.1 alpha/beta fold hydrolase [Adhaeribacter terrigena]